LFFLVFLFFFVFFCIFFWYFLVLHIAVAKNLWKLISCICHLQHFHCNNIFPTVNMPAVARAMAMAKPKPYPLPRPQLLCKNVIVTLLFCLYFS
jgi:hypothetical protein